MCSGAPAARTLHEPDLLVLATGFGVASGFPNRFMLMGPALTHRAVGHR